MSHRVFRTKERKITAVILFIIIIITITFIINQYRKNKHYEEQTVMANEYLKDGNYKQAIDAFREAVKMKSKDEDALTIGLSEAYIGTGDYDMALEVLRSCYKKTAGVMVKEKIEEVTLQMTEYEYLQIITGADKYYANGEYDKAISEYQKAKLIKSKEIISYRRIAEAYIMKNEYALARKEARDGLELTHSDELNQLMDRIDFHLKQQNYKEIVAEADEYIYQDNYEDGIEKYKEAIKLMPRVDIAYLSLAKSYLALNRYEDTIIFVKEALKQVNSDELNSILKKATELKVFEDEKEHILSELYNSFMQLDSNNITKLLNQSFFQNKIASKDTIYYSPFGIGKISSGTVMIIYDKNTIYYGEIKDSVKKGIGIYFVLTRNKYGQGYYYYNGEWNNDIPDGDGKTEEQEFLTNKDNIIYTSKTVTEGTYRNGYENGSMRKYFYRSGKLSGMILYDSIDGEPIPALDENNLPIDQVDGEPYGIAMIYKEDEPTGKYYMVEPDTVWGVKPLIINEMNLK